MSDYYQMLAEIETIQDESLRLFVTKTILKAPEKYWLIPASSSGKYHPAQSLGEGGLLRHILAALYFGREFCHAYSATEAEIDYVQAALILHDVGKAIAEPHDIVWATELRSMAKESFDTDAVRVVIQAVRNHMGVWSTGSMQCQLDERGPKRFPEDFSRVDQIVHLADFAASRKRVDLTKLGTVCDPV